MKKKYTLKNVKPPALHIKDSVRDSIKDFTKTTVKPIELYSDRGIVYTNAGLNDNVKNIVSKSKVNQNTKNFGVVDKSVDSIYVFNNKKELLYREPVITGVDKSKKVDTGLSMKDYFKKYNTTNREDYFKYLKNNNLKITPEGVFQINSVNDNVLENPDLKGRLINTVFRPEIEQQILDSRKRDYGSQNRLLRLTDENGISSSKAIHGTDNEKRESILNGKSDCDRNLSGGCVNVKDDSKALYALDKNSKVIISSNYDDSKDYDLTKDYNYSPKNNRVNKIKNNIRETLQANNVPFDDDKLNFIASVAEKESKSGTSKYVPIERYIPFAKSKGEFQINPSKFKEYLPDDYNGNNINSQILAVNNFYNKELYNYKKGNLKYPVSDERILYNKYNTGTFGTTNKNVDAFEKINNRLKSISNNQTDIKNDMKKKYALGGTNLPEITATAPRLKAKPKWDTVNNTISFIKDGKKQYSTSDKIEELFPEYSTMKSAGVSNGTISTILKQKYSLEEKGTTEVMAKPKVTNDTIQKPKYFLGAVLGGAQLAMSAVNMIQQNKMQKEQVSKENALVAEQDALAMKQKLDIEDVNQRNFGVNTPMHNFYANGGNISIKPKYPTGGNTNKPIVTIPSDTTYNFVKGDVDFYKKQNPGKTTFRQESTGNDIPAWQYFMEEDKKKTENWNDSTYRAKRLRNVQGITFLVDDPEELKADEIKERQHNRENPNSTTASFSRDKTSQEEQALNSYKTKWNDFVSYMNDSYYKFEGALNEFPEFKNIIKSKEDFIRLRDAAGDTESDTDYFDKKETNKPKMANGGVKPTATNISTVVGPKHEQGGVDYKNAEVEGGELIKHEGDNDFVITDDMRIPFDDKHTYAEVAKPLADNKGMLEKVAGAELLKHDKFMAKLNKSGSVTEASTNKRKAEVAKFKADAIDKDVKIYDSKLEELKIDQLQKGMALGLYNEDGTPKYTKGEYKLGAYVKKWNGDKEQYETVWDSTANGEPNPYEVDDAGSELNFIKPEIKESFLAKADNFMGSNQGQAIMGLANAGLNLASNIATSKNMAKLKTPSYIPLTVQDTPLANLSATRQSIEESSDEQSKYATENFSNPQVAAIMKAKIEADKIENLGKVNQQEQTVNLDITNANISRRMGVEQANNQGLQQKQMMDYQKASADINNASNITAALTKDFGDVITNYRKGVMEDKTMDLYGKSFAGAVTDELRASIADNVDLQKVREMTQDEALQYFANQGVYDKSKISNYLKYAKK